MYLLDSDIGIALLRGRPPRPRREPNQRIGSGTTAATSAVVLFELTRGALRSARPDGSLLAIAKLLADIPVRGWTEADAREAARIAADLGRADRAIDPYDLLIAGQAPAQDLVLVSGNVRELGRVQDLRLDNWLA